jgi:carbonic anhydrase
MQEACNVLRKIKTLRKNPTEGAWKNKEQINVQLIGGWFYLNNELLHRMQIRETSGTMGNEEIFPHALAR